LKTWNPITGCKYKCIYCWARRYAERLAIKGVEPYSSSGFNPVFVEKRLRQRLPRNDIIFVSDMGDMWGEWVPKDWIKKILLALRYKRCLGYLFLTKNPVRYLEFKEEFSENMMLGVTIETNRTYNITRGPSPSDRFEVMKNLKWKHKAIIIEPILDFDPEFFNWISKIQPEIVYVGYDNYNNKLPEPQLAKTKVLVKKLEKKFTVKSKNLRKAWFE
jgi:DNA repair photolyase